MESNLTLNMIYELPSKVIDISKGQTKEKEFISLISESICDKYDIDDIKIKLMKMFARFNGIKFYFNVPLTETIKITASYETKEGKSQRSTLDLFGKDILIYIKI